MPVYSAVEAGCEISYGAGMALFFDQEWFDARLGERGLDRLSLAAMLGLHPAEVEDMWKDQREISAREVLLLAELLGVSAQDIARYGGVTTPNPQDIPDMAGIMARMNALEARIGQLEREIASIRKRPPQAFGSGEFS